MNVVIRMGILGFLIFHSVGCMAIYGKRETYAGSGGAKVNGATVSMQVKPEGTRGGAYSLNAMVVGIGVANLDGPFSWRIQAVGRQGVHEAMYIMSLRTVTELTKQDEYYPKKWLGQRVDFFRQKTDKEGEVKAEFQIPGRLQVKPKQDGGLTIYADVIVVAKGGRERKVVKFLLSPTQKSSNEMIFLPAEIVSSMGKSDTPKEDTTWDR